MKTVTIIPAYNEGSHIKKVVKGALKFSDVIVVDDGSSDETFNLANEYATMVIKHQKNQGKGAAIKTGLKKALTGEYKVFVLMDGDGQHNPDFIPDLASKLNNADMVMGSRFKNNDPGNMPFQRRFSNKITTKLIKFVTGYHITDSQSGFRCFSREAALAFLDIPYNDYIYESEMFYQASKQEMVIEETEISCDYHEEKSYINWINILKYTFFVFILIFRRYKEKEYYFRFKSFISGISKED
ncbi:MAG: glycosyltransferase family 2 protein [Methanobacterium sp.]